MPPHPSRQARGDSRSRQAQGIRADRAEPPSQSAADAPSGPSVEGSGDGRSAEEAVDWDLAALDGVQAIDVDEVQLKSLFESFILTFEAPVQEHGRGGGTAAGGIGDACGWDNELFESAPAAGEGTTTVPLYLHQLRRLVELPVEQAAAVQTDEVTVAAAPTALLRFSNTRCFPIDLSHLQKGCPRLYAATRRFAADVIVFMDEVLTDLASREYGDLDALDALAVKVSLFNSPVTAALRDLDPRDLESLVAVRGIVIRCSGVIPDMRKAVFRCTSRAGVRGGLPSSTACGYEVVERPVNNEIREPLLCPKCQTKYSFELYHATCGFGSKQLIKIQETPEYTPEGETPHTVLGYCYDELVDAAKPGDFVEVVGIYRASGVRLVPRTRTLKSVYRTFLDVNSIRKDQLNRYLMDQKDLDGPGADAPLDSLGNIQDEFSSCDQGRPRPMNQQAQNSTLSSQLVDHRERMLALGSNPNIQQILVRSLAPNIWEANDVKLGLLCQLFGGASKCIGGRLSRSDIHILLCGDPSTAKSQLLKYVHGIAPRGVYTCGRGSSAVGLTASVTRDPESKEFVLESGAIVLSDRGVCCVDEFDKMDESARIILHEVMEQQTVSIAKAGIVCSLNARTALLASANPINSRYDPRKSVVDNINVPPSLMSRFDLIYLMLDVPNEALDRALAKHLCELYSFERTTTTESTPIDRKTLAHYITFARQHCKPQLTPEAGALLIETYVEFRQRGTDSSGKSLSATPRQLESLIRLSEALAKMELSEKVLVRHVNEAVRLMQVATYSALIDPTTGRLDFDQLNAGVSGNARARRDLLEKVIFSCLAGLVGGLERTELAEQVSQKMKELNEYPLEPSGRELNILLRELEDFGTVARIHGGRIVSQVGS